MYLKSIELVGFKSFAERTKLTFEPGMTAIVGPNGCGKSNVSDAVRWVLGEQSAKALRGSKMEDVIFNGTDSHKPLSMAEVSMCLAGCEGTLGTEYDEVVITRRVLRSGEGQYFINKTPCRLKDIQRLFMDTGIGTNSYSLMEQGRIDLILSSRPEDRRAVFEEASGITKFKADKKEAIRKLEQTEANLLRLSDIIREVKRRIISLQRQAGKARRYKSLQDELRGLDIYLSRERIGTLTDEVSSLESRLASIVEQDEALRADIRDTEARTLQHRTDLNRIEEEISQAMDAASRAESERNRMQHVMNMNEDRIRELADLSERDNKDANEAQDRLQDQERRLQDLNQRIEQATAERDAAEQDLASSSQRLAELDQAVEDTRSLLNRLRSDSMDLESRSARLQNELSDLDAEERSNVIRRERLAAELGEAKRSVEKFQQRQAHTEGQMQTLKQEVAQREQQVHAVASERNDAQTRLAAVQDQLHEIETRFAARQAQTDLVAESDQQAEGLPGGARALLSSEGDLAPHRQAVLGMLADHVQAAPGYQKALEAAVRPWLDALVISNDASVRDILRALESRATGAARILAVDTSSAGIPAQADGDLLIRHVQCTEQGRAVAERLLRGVLVVEQLTDIPSPLPEGTTWVTKSGSVIRSDGSSEYWTPEQAETNPFSRRHMLDAWKRELGDLDHEKRRLLTERDHLRARLQELEGRLDAARHDLEESRRALALCEGEFQVKAEEAGQAAERQETVAFELNLVNEQQQSGGDRRSAILTDLDAVRKRHEEVRAEINTRTDEIRVSEQQRSEWLSAVTEKRVRAAEAKQTSGHLLNQRESLESRVRELQSLIDERRHGLSNYQDRINHLRQEMNDAAQRIQPLEEEAARYHQSLSDARKRREGMLAALTSFERALQEKRTASDDLRSRKSQIDVELAEQRMRRQNIIERIAQDYHITTEQMINEPDPQWPEGQVPDRDAVETQVAEIRAKLESMGPVNLVAIEEHEELEERMKFLTHQHDDLVSAKQQLMDMIRRINGTTTEMFTRTFDQVNVNFQEMFKKLFGGGSAKLVLVDDEDVLESGIEIIARPPGKKLQTVSLLSGGERTMTAVALLFSLYMVKPSPFCVLDELDAALDDSNIGRFVSMLKGFLDDSQFIVITHNRQTIEAADVLYGVTMEKHGVSKIVSVRFSRHAAEAQHAFQKPEPPPPAETPPEPAPVAPTAG